MKFLRITPSFFVLFIFFTVSRSYGAPFFIEPGSQYAEIEVAVGTEFQVNLLGKGWYLNRYDEKMLSFERRFINVFHTEFIVRSLHAGESYLFFSYLDEDVYVHVNVLDVLPEPPSSSEPAVESEKVDAEEPFELSEDMEVEKSPQKKRKAPPERNTQKTESVQEDIYYVDKENRKVEVPFSGENDEYFQGIRFYKDRELNRASKEFETYLAECSRCSHLLEAHRYLADIYVEMENESEALTHLQILIKHGSVDQKKFAVLTKARLDYRAGRLDEALRSYNGFLDFEPENGKILRRVGDIHFELQVFDAALEAYQKSVEYGVDDDEVYYRLAVIFESPGELKDLEKAYANYKIIVDRFIESKHYTYAQKRVVFLETNFYKYK